MEHIFRRTQSMRLSVLQILLSIFLINQPCIGENIKIGVSTPLTGPAATYGRDIKNALVFVNEKLLNGAYKLIFEDDKCQSREAVSIAHKFAQIDQVKYVLGLACSGPLLSAAPVYEQNKIVVIATSASSPRITDAGDYIFRTWPSNSVSVAVLSDFMRGNFKKIGIISEETDYAQDIVSTLKNLNAHHNIIFVNETFQTDTADFRSLFIRLQNRSVDAVLLLPQSELTLVVLVNQAADTGWSKPILGQFFPGSPSFLNAVGPKSEGIIFADTPFFDSVATSLGQKLYHDFVSEFGRPQSSDVLFVSSVMSLLALHEAIQHSTDVKKYLYTHTFSNVITSYRFDTNGDVIGMTYILKKVIDGYPVLFEGREG